jgi:tRNA threonylcarbamoyladenosine biosynthesis protein TsaB
MAVFLLIETATPVCSVALIKDAKLLAIRESKEENIHSSLITVFIKEACEETSLPLEELDAIAVSKGPGSYTGLRIGVSVAKGLCYALDKPLISVPTLLSMANGARALVKDDVTDKPNALLCPMIDARRMEVYTAVYDNDLNVLMDTSAMIIDEQSFSHLLNDHQMYFFGNGAVKCREIFTGHENASFIDSFYLSSSFMTSLVEDAFQQKRFEDVAYFEPFYLKDFIAGKPKVKGLD